MSNSLGNSKTPFSATLIMRQESYVKTVETSNGYTSKVDVEGGMLMKVDITADTLEELKAKISKYSELA